MSDAAIPDAATPELKAEPAFDEVPGPVFPARAATTTRSRRLLAAAWLLTALVLIGLAWATVSHRVEIMRAWPPSQRAYAAMGLIHPDDPAKLAEPK